MFGKARTVEHALDSALTHHLFNVSGLHGSPQVGTKLWLGILPSGRLPWLEEEIRQLVGVLHIARLHLLRDKIDHMLLVAFYEISVLLISSIYKLYSVLNSGRLRRVVHSIVYKGTKLSP